VRERKLEKEKNGFEEKFSEGISVWKKPVSNQHCEEEVGANGVQIPLD